MDKSFASSKCIEYYFPNFEHTEFSKYGKHSLENEMYENIFKLNLLIDNIICTITVFTHEFEMISSCILMKNRTGWSN